MNNTAVPRREHTLQPGEIVALALMYLISAATVFKVKEAQLQDGGYRIVSRLSGQNEEVLTWLGRFQLFSLDILLLLACIPILLYCLSRYTGRNTVARTTLLLSVGLIILSFVNINALGTTGKFLSVDQVGPMFDWVRERPSSVLEYVSVGAFVRLAVVMVGVGLLYVTRRARLFALFTPGPLLILLFAGTLTVLALYTHRLPSLPVTNYDTAVLVQMGRTLLPVANSAQSGGHTFAPASMELQCDKPAASTAKPVPPVARNFIFFIMETVPDDVFSQAKGPDFRTFEDMQRSGYTAPRHYSTYPFTSYARFSIFTGLYPSYRLERTLPIGTEHPYRSFFSSLVSQGYDFKVFDPVTVRYEVDDWLIKQLGGTVQSVAGGKQLAEKDELVLDELIANVSQAAESKTPFAYAYLPQVSHGPWLPAGASKAALYAEGLNRLRQLDKSLAAIVAVLKHRGVYENTVLVVTADHGLRTRKEAGFLKTAVLNDQSYHVPMIVHDPMMRRAVTLDTVTSHLDISPTMQCLYLDGAPPITTQGRVMTAGGGAARTLFFGGAWYNGSDGLWDGKHFYSYNRQLNMLWESTRFDFDEARPLHASQQSDALIEQFDRQGSAQEALLRN